MRDVREKRKVNRHMLLIMFFKVFSIDSYRGLALIYSIYVPNLMYVYIYEASILASYNLIGCELIYTIQVNAKPIVERY